ncbi:MAG: hypothetical protein KKB70_00550 [Proteobacteria bacterium]|nr:hypothetical protein [Pseudomonadota bacterium]
MKTYCIHCRNLIHTLDFYVETKKGRICSSCLVEQPEPGHEIKELFRKPGKHKDPTKEITKQTSFDLHSNLN